MGGEERERSVTPVPLRNKGPSRVALSAEERLERGVLMFPPRDELCIARIPSTDQSGEWGKGLMKHSQISCDRVWGNRP